MTNTLNTRGSSPARSKRSARIVWTAVIILVSFVLGVVVGMAGEPQEPADLAERRAVVERGLIANDRRERDLIRQSDELAAEVAALEEGTAELDAYAKELDEREAKISTAEKAVAANTVSEGVWTVGVDIKAGTYRATNVSSDCYWMISRTGSNGDIIQNDIPGGGNPQVVLSKGQDFTSSDCGDWVRQ